jgi:hypothetical protein
VGVKIALVIGGVEVTLSGVDLTARQVKELMRSAASIALALPPDSPATPDTPTNPIGFTAHVERASEEDAADWYEE